ncbi:GNAT family N-acetyltransferase [Saccharibacillus kuerlensis]|uniref:N-acetyltransferase n=1 Tax=Saccharibacillus kuerlensis TaxID=459527 RepID=A0ABQ2L521_9BACL|nr:GNAT family N-acetyltransferase [Saccharibacillus kuerlensis]GGO01190.1 N-acetyltransferase [Saccharibacillus kuerlensis]
MHQSSTIQLRPITIDDFDTILCWSRDDSFCLANGWETNRDEEELRRWWSYCVHMKKETFTRIGIQWESRLIGYGDLAGIGNGCAELGIAIGESNLWGKGIGHQAALSIVEYGRETYALTTFTAETHESNKRSRRMLEKIGFEEISRNGFEEYAGKIEQLIQYRL